MLGILSPLRKQEIPTRIRTSDGRDYYGIVTSLPGGHGASYDYVVLKLNDNTAGETEESQVVYISTAYIVAVKPDRLPAAVKRGRHGDPVEE